MIRAGTEDFTPNRLKVKLASGLADEFLPSGVPALGSALRKGRRRAKRDVVLGTAGLPRTAALTARRSMGESRYDPVPFTAKPVRWQSRQRRTKSNWTGRSTSLRDETGFPPARE